MYEHSEQYRPPNHANLGTCLGPSALFAFFSKKRPIFGSARCNEKMVLYGAASYFCERNGIFAKFLTNESYNSKH
jgi:hypothetical protein